MDRHQVIIANLQVPNNLQGLILKYDFFLEGILDYVMDFTSQENEGNEGDEESDLSPVSKFAIIRLNKRNKIVAASFGNINIYDEKTKELENVLQGSNTEISKIYPLKGKIIVGFSNGSLGVYYLDTLKCQLTFKGHNDIIMSIALFSNYMVTGSRDHTVRLWNLNTGQCLALLNEHTTHVTDVFVTKNKIISRSTNEIIISSLVLNEEDIISGFIGCIFILPTGNIAYGQEKYLRVWDIQTKRVILTLPHSDDVWKISNIKDFLITGSADQIITVFNLRNGTTIRLNNENIIHSITVLKNNTIAVSGEDIITIWDLETQEKMIIDNGAEASEIKLLEDKMLVLSVDDFTIKSYK